MIVCRKGWTYPTDRPDDRAMERTSPRPAAVTQTGPVFVPRRALSAFALTLLAQPRT